MAYDPGNRTTFQDIDWDEENAGFSFTRLQLAQLATFGLLVYGYLWDYLRFDLGPVSWGLGNQHPTIDGIGIPLTSLEIPRTILVFEEGGVYVRTQSIVWDITSLDWLALLFIVFAVFYVVYPLYRKRDLTAYYWRRFKRNTEAVAGLAVLALMSVIAVVGPFVLTPPDIAETIGLGAVPPMGVTAEVQGVQKTGSLAHPLGTTTNGKDLLVLLVLGAKISLEVGLLAMFIAISIGTVVGSVAAYSGGIVDEVLMRYVDIQSVFPVFLFLLLLIYLFGASLFLIIVLYGFFGWEGTARLVRSEALQRTEEAYVQAAEAAGASRLYIIRRHIVPNVSRTVVTNATLAIPGFILGEASLAFLGFSDPEIFSWGQTIAQGRSGLGRGVWWTATIPGFFLFFMVLAFNYVGDAANDAIDPRGEK
jgi:peptide/nickel transport system permease protein